MPKLCVEKYNAVGLPVTYILSFQAQKQGATTFTSTIQKWMGRTFFTLSLLGTSLFVFSIVRTPAVAIVDHIALVGVFLPAVAAALALVASILAVLAASMLTASVDFAEVVVRRLVENKLNLGYTLLGIVMFSKEILDLLK